MKNLKKETGSITLFVLTSIMFFVVVLLGIYVSFSNKIQAQDKELNRIQKNYKTENINDVYNRTYQINKEKLI